MTLKEYFKSTGVMKKFFAEKLGISRTYLHDLLAKRTQPSLQIAYLIFLETKALMADLHLIS